MLYDKNTYLSKHLHVNEEIALDEFSKSNLLYIEYMSISPHCKYKGNCKRMMKLWGDVFGYSMKQANEESLCG